MPDQPATAFTFDFDSLSKRQQDVLGWVAIGVDLDLGHHPRTLASLVKLGLIEEYEEHQPGALGMLRVKRYATPLHVHVAWCYWCAETCEDEE